MFFWVDFGLVLDLREVSQGSRGLRGMGGGLEDRGEEGEYFEGLKCPDCGSESVQMVL